MHPALFEIFCEVLPVAIILVAEEDDDVDDVASEDEGFVSRDGGRDPSKFGVTDENRREEEGAVAVDLGRSRECRTVNT